MYLCLFFLLFTAYRKNTTRFPDALWDLPRLEGDTCHMKSEIEYLNIFCDKKKNSIKDRIKNSKKWKRIADADCFIITSK